MPILHIKALPQKDSSLIKSALKKTCIAIAKCYGCDEKHVWATWAEIKPGLYVEGSNDASSQPLDTHPPICELIMFEPKSIDVVQKVLKIASATLSNELKLQNNVFIIYRKANSGEVIFGEDIVFKGAADLD